MQYTLAIGQSYWLSSIFSMRYELDSVDNDDDQSINQDFNSRWQTATRQGTYGKNKNKKYSDTQ